MNWIKMAMKPKEYGELCGLCYRLARSHIPPIRNPTLRDIWSDRLVLAFVPSMAVDTILDRFGNDVCYCGIIHGSGLHELALVSWQAQRKPNPVQDLRPICVCTSQCWFAGNEFSTDAKQSDKDLLLRYNLAKFFYHQDNLKSFMTRISAPNVRIDDPAAVARAFALTYCRQRKSLSQYVSLLVQVFGGI